MVGPFFLVILSLREGCNDVHISRRISRIGAENEIGLVFGDFSIRYVLKNVATFVEAALKEVPNHLSFLVTSNPLEYDAMNLFQEQLDVLGGAEPSNSSLIRFLAEMWSLAEIHGALISIWDSMLPDYNKMPQYTMTFNQFQDQLKDYYLMEQKNVGKGGGQGMFRISKMQRN